jgi:hypothetical protein
MGWKQAGTLVLGGLLLALPVSARADENDLVLSRFVHPLPPDSSGNVPIGAAQPPDAAKIKFRSLVSELGVVLAPRLLSPADTIGYGGFQFSAEFAYTSINHNADYWDATRRVNLDQRQLNRPPSFMPTAGIFARKGLWLPLPSFEIGVGAVHVDSSNMWGLQAYAKFAIHEGFHNWPFPSVAVRVAGSRLLGSEDLDLTVASLDVSVSKAFGLGGTVTLVPYAGWNYLWIVPRSGALDASPWCDAFKPSSVPGDTTHPCPSANNQTDLNANFAFPTQSVITRQRVFVGAKLKFYLVALTAEWESTFASGSVDQNDLATLIADQAQRQTTFALSASLDF